MHVKFLTSLYCLSLTHADGVSHRTLQPLGNFFPARYWKYMPAVNRRSRVSPAKTQTVQHCASLLSCSDNKLVKVRSIGLANPAGGSDVQVSIAAAAWDKHTSFGPVTLVKVKLTSSLPQLYKPILHGCRSRCPRATAFSAFCLQNYKDSCYSEAAASS